VTARTVQADPHLAAVRASADPIRVLVADDHPLFRRGLARAIERRPGLELVGEAVDGDEALELIGLLRPDVAVVDVRMPGLSGLQLCAEVSASDTLGAVTAVVLLSAFDDEALVAAAARDGAAAYLVKDASQGAVCEAIEAAAHSR
jgi:two-component system, NarL family, nitrate/nitrite response regulator NarL